MSIRPRALWLGLAAASLAAVLVAAGLLVWQRQEPRRYTTVAELNDALNAAGRRATAMRNVQTTRFGWSTGPFETTRDELARRDARGIHYRATSGVTASGGPPKDTGVIVVTPDGAWLSAAGLREADRAALPRGKTWVAINPDAPLPMVASQADNVRTIRRPEMFGFRLDGTYQILDTRKETVEGTPAYHYTLRKNQDEPGTERTFEVWVDAQDRPVHTIERSVSQTTERLQDSRYSGWTDQPRIDPPPPDQVFGR